MIHTKKGNILRFCVAGLLACLVFIWMGQVAYADTYVTVTGTTVNIRSAPEINPSNLVTTVARGDTVRVVGVSGDFYRATKPAYGYVYIFRDLTSFYRTLATMATPAAWVFDLADTIYGTPIGLAVYGDSFFVVSYYGDWYGILYEGELAFIERNHLYIPYFVNVPAARQSTGNSVADEVVAKALRYLGRPYQWGGNGPHAFDCSGFVIYVLRPFGVTLPRRSRDMVTSGVHVNRSDVQPGDLLFFATMGGRTVSHVGMYIGNGQLIHSASTRSGGVIISDFHSAYYVRTFVTARRVL